MIKSDSKYMLLQKNYIMYNNYNYIIQFWTCSQFSQKKYFKEYILKKKKNWFKMFFLETK